MTRFEMKNILGLNNCRLDSAEEEISELEDLTLETFKNETQNEKNIFKRRTEHQ